MRICRDADPCAVDLCPTGSGGEDTAPRREPGSCPKSASVWPGDFFTLLKLSTEAGLLEQSQRGKSRHKNPVKMHIFQAVCCLTEPGRCCCVGFSPPLSANVLAPVNAATFCPCTAGRASPAQGVKLSANSTLSRLEFTTFTILPRPTDPFCPGLISLQFPRPRPTLYPTPFGS